MSEETWLIGREVDASKKILVITGILVFDFELFIGGRSVYFSGLGEEALKSSSILCYYIGRSVQEYCS